MPDQVLALMTAHFPAFHLPFAEYGENKHIVKSLQMQNPARGNQIILKSQTESGQETGRSLPWRLEYSKRQQILDQGNL